jgi:hypothetical protein
MGRGEAGRVPSGENADERTLRPPHWHDRQVDMAGGEPGGPAAADRPPRIFLSVAGPDVAWGEWIYRQLRRAGYEVEFYKRSFPIGASFVASIDMALARADRMIALLAPGYCDPGSWVTEEWQAALQIAHSRPGFLVPLLVECCELPPLPAGLNHVDLVGIDETAAAARMVEALAAGGGRADEGTDRSSPAPLCGPDGQNRRPAHTRCRSRPASPSVRSTGAREAPPRP